ncbi:conserved hypothetical protein [Gammaproteobacteria bacterium]
MKVLSAKLNANLQALALFAPIVFKQLQFALKEEISEQHDISDGNLSELPLQSDAVLFGIGKGELLIRLLCQPGRRILLIEPDLFQVIRVLRNYDFSLIFSQGRLHLCLPVLKQELFNELAYRETLIEIQCYVQSATSGVCWLNAGSRWHYEKFFLALEQALFQWCDGLDRFIPRSRAKPEFHYDITVVSPSCAIFDDLAVCLNEIGWRTRLIRIPDDDTWDTSHWWSFIDDLSNKPSRLTVLRNRIGLQTSDWQQRFAWERILPGRILSWWWDIPNIISHLDFRDSFCQLPSLALARNILTVLPLGSTWLPAGARSSFTRSSDNDIVLDSSITFVGQSRYQPMLQWLRTLKQGSVFFGFAEMARFFDELIQQTDWILAYEVMEKNLPVCEQNLISFAEIQPNLVYFLNYLLKMVHSTLLRLAVLQKIAAQKLPIRVYGDEGWILSKTVQLEQFFGILDIKDLPGLYRRSRINLNVDFMQSASAPNPKVLDIAAVGGIVVTNAKPELSWLYPDPAIRPFVFDNLTQLPELLYDIMNIDLTDYKRRLRAYTLAHHTMLQRARDIGQHYLI